MSAEYLGVLVNATRSSGTQLRHAASVCDVFVWRHRARDLHTCTVVIDDKPFHAIYLRKEKNMPNKLTRKKLKMVRHPLSRARTQTEKQDDSEA